MQSGFPQPDVDPFDGMVIGAALLAPAFCEDLSTWRMTVARDGTVAQELRTSFGGEIYECVSIHLRSFVPREVIAEIMAIADEIHFRSFDAEYHADATDLQHTSITLIDDGIPKRVASYGPQLLAYEGNVPMLGYMRLWEMLLKISPYQWSEATAAPDDDVLNRIKSLYFPSL